MEELKREVNATKLENERLNRELGGWKNEVADWRLEVEAWKRQVEGWKRENEDLQRQLAAVDASRYYRPINVVD
jgi:chromosome segregation ATPase